MRLDRVAERLGVGRDDHQLLVGDAAAGHAARDELLGRNRGRGVAAVAVADRLVLGDAARKRRSSPSCRA